jgi:hypothetical protein
MQCKASISQTKKILRRDAAMKPTPKISNGALAILGTIMMVAWFAIVGLGGFLLLLGAFYAMSGGNLTLLVITCFGLSLPLALTLIWGFGAIDRWVREPKPERSRPAPRPVHTPDLAHSEAVGR